MAKRYYDGMYAGADSRRAMERSDAGMVPGDKGVANMPQSVVYRAYPSSPYNMPEGLNDVMSGIDTQIKDDMKEKKPINSEKF